MGISAASTPAAVTAAAAARGFPVVALPTPVLGAPPSHERMHDGCVPRGRLTLALSAILGLPNNAATERRVNAAVRFELWYGRVPSSAATAFTPTVVTPGMAGRGGGGGGSSSSAQGGWGVARATSSVVRSQPISAISFSAVTVSGGGGGGSTPAGEREREEGTLQAAGGSGLFGGNDGSSSARSSASPSAHTTVSGASGGMVTSCESVFLAIADVAHLPPSNSSSATPLPWLVYSVVSPGLWGEEVLATGALAVGSLFSAHTAGTPQRVELPLTPHKRTVGPASIAPESSLFSARLVLDSCFHGLTPGVLVVTLKEARNLTNRAYLKQVRGAEHAGHSKAGYYLLQL